ncbi:uncharacterized protein [Asterias amurensis]|uniref:uncharacterized protein n=1 Tax=Asterias amurensis TaxID=7602 RepID=UPI003AB20A49
MKWSVELIVCALALLSYGVNGAPDCLDTFTSEQCVEYTETGGGRIVLSGNKFDDAMQDQLKMVIANISNQYVITKVEPRHIVVTTVNIATSEGVSQTDEVTVYFFVANPTESVVMPIAFRSKELYLMMTMNKDKIEDMLEYEITALEPGIEDQLPLPTWALAIIVYVGLVVVVALIYFGTSDIRSQWSASSEEKLRKAVMGDSDMQIDPEAGVPENGNKPAKMYRENQTSFGVQVRKEDIAVTLGITYATVEENGNVTKTPNPDAPPPPNPPEYMEVLPEGATPPTADTAADKHEAEATAALEGAINHAYEEMPEDKTTSL